jgi:hypothetical protein
LFAQVAAWLLTGQGGRYVRMFREAGVGGGQLASLLAKHSVATAAAAAHADAKVGNIQGTLKHS